MKKMIAIVLALLLLTALLPVAYAETPDAAQTGFAVASVSEPLAAEEDEGELPELPDEFGDPDPAEEFETAGLVNKILDQQTEEPPAESREEGSALFGDLDELAGAAPAKGEDSSARRKLLDVVTEEEPKLPADAWAQDVPDYTEKGLDESRAYNLPDQVELTSDTVAVLTAEGIGIAYRIPSRNIYVLTQDYLQQADTFALFYSNPLAAAADFVKDGTHLNIFEPDTGLDIYVDIYPSSVANMFPDASRLSNSEIESVMMYYLRNGFDVADTVVFGDAGGNSYFFFDCTSAYGGVYMFTMVGGYTVRIFYRTNNSAAVSRGLQLLESLMIVAI